MNFPAHNLLHARPARKVGRRVQSKVALIATSVHVDSTPDTKEQMTVMNVPQGCTAPKRVQRNVKIVREESLWMNLAAIEVVTYVPQGRGHL